LNQSIWIEKVLNDLNHVQMKSNVLIWSITWYMLCK